MPAPRPELAAPAVASRRQLLRAGLPSAYRRPGHQFLDELLEACEEVLDPVLAMLDALAAHFALDLAPDDVLELMAAWLGIELDDTWSGDMRRRMLSRASELARRRGTAGGIQAALRIAFPGLPLRVEDESRVAAAMRPEDLPPPGIGRLTVWCEIEVGPATHADIARMVREFTPAHVPFRLKVPDPPRGDVTS